MTKYRIQKLIALAGICSRRKAEELLIENRVLLNGSVANIGESADPSKDLIQVDGKEVIYSNISRVIILNKPPGIISSCSDQFGRRTVLALLPDKLQYGMHPVGRLDLKSRGALLLTNNGELTLRLTHPRYEHSKTYLVLLRGKLSRDKLFSWQKGIMLDGKMTMPAGIRVIDSLPKATLLEVKLIEGRYRQIRRVAKLLGHEVIDLQRTEIAGIKLGKLKEGSWRELLDSEWKQLLNPIQKSH